MILGVTGGSGYVGSVLLPALCPLADKIVLFDLLPPKAEVINQIPLQKLEYLPIDLTDLNTFQNYSKKIDHWIHLAGLVGYPACESDKELAYFSNQKTTENLLLAKRSNAPVLMASTISCYGDQSTRVDESSRILPNSTYGKTKAMGEQAVLTEKQNIVFRFAGGFGASPQMRHGNLINDFVAQAVQKHFLAVYESHFIRQFIHLKDMVRAIIFALKNWRGLQGEIYNIGNEAIEITKGDLIHEMQKFLSFKADIGNSGSDLEKRNYPISFKKFLLKGFKPQITLEDGLKELITYYKKPDQFSFHGTFTEAKHV